jgi:hypothetical protein
MRTLPQALSRWLPEICHPNLQKRSGRYSFIHKFSISMFCALTAAKRTVADCLAIRTFQLAGSEGGAGILILEDESSMSFANQGVTIIGGYSAFIRRPRNPTASTSSCPVTVASGEPMFGLPYQPCQRRSFPSPPSEQGLRFRTMFRSGE